MRCRGLAPGLTTVRLRPESSRAGSRFVVWSTLVRVRSVVVQRSEGPISSATISSADWSSPAALLQVWVRTAPTAIARAHSHSRAARCTGHLHARDGRATRVDHAAAGTLTPRRSRGRSSPRAVGIEGRNPTRVPAYRPLIGDHRASDHGLRPAWERGHWDPHAVLREASSWPANTGLSELVFGEKGKTRATGMLARPRRRRWQLAPLTCPPRTVEHAACERRRWARACRSPLAGEASGL